jgi:hypothetical protein
MYGGGDPKITYNRNRLAPRADFGYDLGLTVATKCDIDDFRRIVNNSECSITQLKWLAICGKYYLLVKLQGEHEFSLFNEAKHKDLFIRRFKKHIYTYQQDFEKYLGKFSEDLVKFSRELNAPVFCINAVTRDPKTKVSTVTLDGDIPVLSKLGIQKVYAPEQLYQDLAYFLANIIHPSPDLQPEPKPPMTDKEKIVSHGLDLKKSFRHRK